MKPILAIFLLSILIAYTTFQANSQALSIDSTSIYSIYGNRLFDYVGFDFIANLSINGKNCSIDPVHKKQIKDSLWIDAYYSASPSSDTCKRADSISYCFKDSGNKTIYFRAFTNTDTAKTQQTFMLKKIAMRIV
ncbi:MAG: hypothetical protein ACJAZ3_000131 [Sphingobacteriales bacterium]|jgi:hypothetical protein